MIRSSLKLAEWTLRDLRARAWLVGATLAWVAWEMSRLQGSDGGSATAIVFVAASTASFVLHALHLEGARAPIDMAQRAATARACVIRLGCAFALSAQAFESLFG